MPEAQFYTAATTSADWIAAGVSIAVALAIAHIVDRTIAKRGGRVRELVGAGDISPATQTRLRVIRRLVYALIVFIGIAIAASRFDELSSVAKGILASSAVLGLVVGFAARQTLANAIAGILLAITQPIRIGDLVKFEGESGVVEDVRLTYTYLRAEDNRRIIVPNERLAASTIENFTIVDPRTEVEVTIGLPLETDPNRAIETLSEMDDTHVEVSAVEKDGYELLVRSHAGRPLDRREVAARIRAACVERLRRENILG